MPVAAIELALEQALQDMPAPSLRQLAQRLGFSSQCVLKAHAPAPYQKVKARWKTYAETRRAELRIKLVAALEEDPPPSLRTRRRVSLSAVKKVSPQKPTPGPPPSLKARRYSMVMLVNLLSGVAERGPGIDKTRLDGVYDFTLSWDEDAGPSLSTALREQLGLRMESEKVPVSLFVVDSAQPPAGN
jgi:uncharacterized protein (TIGR03435 family)